MYQGYHPILSGRYWEVWYSTQMFSIEFKFSKLKIELSPFSSNRKAFKFIHIIGGGVLNNSDM